MKPKPLTDKQRYWLTHIERCQESRQSLASYAQAHSLDIQTLYRWKSTLGQRGCIESSTATATAKFTRVAVEPHWHVERATIEVKFPNDCLLRCEASDEATLRALTRALLSGS